MKKKSIDIIAALIVFCKKFKNVKVRSCVFFFVIDFTSTGRNEKKNSIDVIVAALIVFCKNNLKM